jgi:hypothetical protein
VKTSDDIDPPQAGGYNIRERSSPRVARRNKAPNQILNRHDATKIFLSVEDGSKAESGGAQLLHHPIGGFHLSSRYDAPDVIGQRFASILIKQDIEDVN